MVVKLQKTNELGVYVEKERIKQLLTEIAASIACTFGRNCQTVVQDLGSDNHPVVAVYSGSTSSSEVGPLPAITHNEADRTADSADTKLSQGPKHLLIKRAGKGMKSTTIHAQGKGYHYSLTINYDYTPIAAAKEILKDMIGTPTDAPPPAVDPRRGRIEEIYAACLSKIGVKASEMKKRDRLHLILMLRREGAFEYQKSIPFVAKQLNVSRYTIYKYMKELEGVDCLDCEKGNPIPYCSLRQLACQNRANVGFAEGN
ncbi:MAG: helix-turn-helix domain-containing protein [Bacillota bacterium]|jgi:predicted transcriptional regulator YheO